MAYPFPEGPVTPDVVEEQIGLGGWKSCVCPLCDNTGSASWHIDDKDAARYICPTCQRFELSGPQKAVLNNQPARKSELSQLAAESKEVAKFGTLN